MIEKDSQSGHWTLIIVIPTFEQSGWLGNQGAEAWDKSFKLLSTEIDRLKFCETQSCKGRVFIRIFGNQWNLRMVGSLYVLDPY